MGHTNKSERKTVFGLRTDHMSIQIYNHLERKARSKKLASYIIQLVEQDLANKAPFNARNELLEITKNQEQMMSTIKQLTKKISILQVSPTLNVLEPNEENEKSSLEDDLLKDVGPVGQLITGTTLKGFLDDEDLENLDF